ncbi:MAG: hypothetical protein PHT54_02740 [Candidatus Nanoarchaeia archaeon]|nr:hypothetical protein [Candidatus Nanoarchaeia archaeon]
MGDIISWIVVLIGAVFAFIGGHILITKVLPKLSDLVNPLFKNEKTSHSFILILIIFIFVLVLRKIVVLLIGMNNTYLNILAIINPGLEVILEFVPYVQWLFVAILIGYALRKD